MYQEIVKRVESYGREKGILKKNTGIVIGLSGGADSVFLTWILTELRQNWHLRLCAVHVNHGIRGEEAMRDEKFSEKFAAACAIPFYRFEENIPAFAEAHHMSEEEAGRYFRYQCFEEMRNRLGYDVIAVAHHRDDQAETILFQMLRGCGMRGLGGMRAVRDKIVRPLLCVEKEEILRGLEENGLEFCVDSTNEETRYQRNKIRREIMPLLQQMQEGAVAHLVRLGEEMQEVADCLAALTEECFQRIVGKQEDYFKVEEGEFLRLPAVIQRELIMRMLEELAGQRKDIGFVHVEQIQKLFAGGTGKCIDLPYGLQGWKEYQFACLGKKMPGERQEVPGKLEPGKKILFTDSRGEKWVLSGGIKPRELVSEINLKKNCTKCFDYDRMVTMPRFRYWEEGDYLCLTKEGQRKKLSRIFVDDKIPRQCRRRITVLAEGSHVLWIPELERQSAYFYVTEQTQRVLCLERLIE